MDVQFNFAPFAVERVIEGNPDRKNKIGILPSEKLQQQITTIHSREKLNSTTDSLSRFCRSRDYTLKDGMIQMIYKTWNYIPQIDKFATQFNKLINNYVKVDLNDLGTHFDNAFNYKWSKVKLYIHPPIPLFNMVLQKMKQDKAEGLIIALIWPQQSSYTKLKNLSIKIIFRGLSQIILEIGQRMKDKDQNLPPGNVGIFLLDLSQTHQPTTYKTIKRTKDNKIISIFNSILSNNRTGKAGYP
ncbi:MAG: hypothetical protein EZS28_020360 [Streblomastix strix]|uniref:Uncharacterized protein n=1 Tax=Streblomastix strix TaxID=222440 RepID=A0A5J4VNN9_9EUKA|nr:MAG: hypothetical protein EZS28_020360 [Streblomastix strix]